MSSRFTIKKLQNGLQPQTPLMPDEDVLFSEVCTVKDKQGIVESLVAITSERLLIEPWKKRASHKVISLPYTEIVNFYTKDAVPVLGVVLNKYLVIETVRGTLAIMTQKQTKETIERHIQYFMKQKKN